MYDQRDQFFDEWHSEEAGYARKSYRFISAQLRTVDRKLRTHNKLKLTSREVSGYGSPSVISFLLVIIQSTTTGLLLQKYLEQHKNTLLYVHNGEGQMTKEKYEKKQ